MRLDREESKFDVVKIPSTRFLEQGGSFSYFFWRKEVSLVLAKME